MTEENTERRSGRKAGEILRAIARGEFLFTLKCDKFFPHIIYFFFLICIVLAVNLMIEKTMVEAERNKAEIYDLKIYLTHINSELVGLGKLSKVQEMLEASGSELTVPETPVTVLKK